MTKRILAWGIVVLVAVVLFPVTISIGVGLLFAWALKTAMPNMGIW